MNCGGCVGEVVRTNRQRRAERPHALAEMQRIARVEGQSAGATPSARAAMAVASEGSIASSPTRSAADVGANRAVAVGDRHACDRSRRRLARAPAVGAATMSAVRAARSAPASPARQEVALAIRVFHSASRRGGRPTGSTTLPCDCIACARCASGSRPALDSPSSRRSWLCLFGAAEVGRFEQRERGAQALRFAGAAARYRTAR